MPTKVIKPYKSFVDISLSFEPSVVTGDITVLKNERAINNSLKNIVMTHPTETPFRHDIGSNVSDYLFEVIDEATSALLTIEIERSIRFNEPRVELESVTVEPQPNLHQFACNITYRIVGYAQIYEFDTILEPTR
jgi:hypothetical protein